MSDSANPFQSYAASLTGLMSELSASGSVGQFMSPDLAMQAFLALIDETVSSNGRLFFIGNGGSAGICSHMAIDYAKNGRIPSLCFNDGAALTCLSNDCGYENVFVEQLKIHATPSDLLVAVSSSGNSPNIVGAAGFMNNVTGGKTVTLSGFSPENALRGLGEINFHVASNSYGFVEIAHLMILHAVLDRRMGLV